jgi:putative IMPACT (imprinted ancient) family translation regulator
LKNLIEDRKSKFSGTFYKVNSVDEVKKIIKNLKQDKFYKKATHNIYAYRILTEDGIVE